MSTFIDHDSTSLAEELGARWNRFWFTPADPLPACVLRIVVGLVAVAHFLDCGLGLNLWYAADSVLPPAAVSRLLELTGDGEANYHYSYLSHISNRSALWAVHAAAIVAALAFAIGFLTRVTGLITLISMLAMFIASHRSPGTWNPSCRF